MQLRYLKTLHPPQEAIAPITAITWSPNTRKLAVCSIDRIVHLFDDAGERQDKFSTKPADPKGPKNYTVVGMAFSPDSGKLAVAQSDNIVFVYKLGVDWHDKKSICNKFQQSSAVTCLTWPSRRPQEIVFGLAEGKVKVGQLRSNKAATLYTTDSYVVSCSSSPDGNSVISGHLDGSVYRFCFDNGTGDGSAAHSKLTTHTSVPYALSWGESICLAGNDNCVTFYDPDGNYLQQFNYAGEENQKEFTCASFNPSGESVVVGSFNKMHIFNYNMRDGKWKEAGLKEVENMYSVTSMAWKQDGNRFVVGALCGLVDMYDACIRRHRYKNKFEFTYVSLSQVIVKRLATGTRIVLKSHFGYEIEKINVFQDRYLVAHTPDTLLMGDLETCKLSEVPWNGSGSEKFHFDYESVCMIYNAGELSFVEYGRNEILGSCRTEHVSPHLISVRLDDDLGPEADEMKKVAYLIDLQTVNIQDLYTGLNIATINHEAKIDWLEMSEGASHLLFRDKRRQLHLYNIEEQTRSTLLSYCSYVQWVPESDVVVAQNRDSLCVWYSINAPERVTIFPIKGEIEDIERANGRTEVVVDEGMNTVSYALDESLIAFGSAVERRNFGKAVDLLEQLELTPETEAMWQTLSKMALDHQKLHIAERCYAALGDVAKARYLHKVVAVQDFASEKYGGDGIEFYHVKAKLACLEKQFKKAESLLLEQGQIDVAVEMYMELHRWDEAIAVAESKGGATMDVENMKRQYYDWLLENGQEEKAAQVKEKAGDFNSAIRLYLQGGLPARAAQVAQQHGVDSQLQQTIAQALMKGGMYEKAGEFFENLAMPQKALDAYRKGRAYRRAVELSRRESPSEVVSLEEEWGDWLASQHQLESAFNHFVEAGQYMKAVEAAIGSRQWNRAMQTVDQLEPEVAQQYQKRIARQLEESRKYEEAERYYVRSRYPQEAVDMWIRQGKWDNALRVAENFKSPKEVQLLCIQQAQKLEEETRYKEAETLYLRGKEIDDAINMYKKARMYDDMIRLVSTFRKDLLVETHLHLAQQLEAEGNFRAAEHHFAEAKEWKAAVNMYRVNNLWEDALRTAKVYGGVNASKHVAFLWASSLGGEAGAKLLTKLGLIEQAIDYACESGSFAFAFELAKASCKTKIPEVHVKHAMYLEDEGQFKEAEEEFIKGNKPKEAIDMYIHMRDWPSAMNLAENYETRCIPDVLAAQGKECIEKREFSKAEQLFLRARKPELAVNMYRDADDMKSALRVAKDHAPQLVPSLENAKRTGAAPGAGGMQQHIPELGAARSGDPTAEARMYEAQGEWSRAIDAYLTISKDDTGDLDYLEQVWETAVKLAMSHETNRISEVMSIVSKKLISINRYRVAADLYEGFQMYKEAIDVYVQGQMFDEARSLANRRAPQMLEYINSSVGMAPANEMPGMGVGTQALDLLAQQGDWERCMRESQREGEDCVAKYGAQYAKDLVNKGDYEGAVGVFQRYGAPPQPAVFDLYKRISHEILALDPPRDAALQGLKEVLYKLVSGLEGLPGHSEFEQLLFIVHFITQKIMCSNAGLSDTAAKLAISLVRYCTDVPADKAFHDAGQCAKDMGWNNMAFVFFNRYLDLTEAMEEPEMANMIDNSDFANSDIPFDFPLPEKSQTDEEKSHTEEVRNWVLQVSMDNNTDQSLDTRNCDSCGAGTFSGSLKCHSCATTKRPCIITGFPVLRDSVKCPSCNMVANRSDWNNYVGKVKTCPWCGAVANAMMGGGDFY